jgi:4-amino-4-deoxy-L-arabinose transferase-like glycosyltransferase
MNLKTITNELKIRKKTWVILLLIFLFGFYLRNAEYHFGIHVDGYIYAEGAKYIVSKGIFVRDCGIGNLESCRFYEPVLYPPGYPYLISLLYLIFGIHSILGSQLSAVLSSMTIFLIYFICYILFKNEEVGLYSALVFSLIPLDLFHANTGNFRSTMLFFLSLTVIFYLIALKKNTVKIWSLVAVALSFTIYVGRQASFILLPFLIYGFLFERKKIMLKNFVIPFVIFVVTQLPVQYWLITNYSNIFAGQSVFSFLALKIMIPIVVRDMFIQTNFFGLKTIFNPIASVLFVLSTVFILNLKYRKPIIFVWSWFLVFFLLNAFYFQCPGFPEHFCGDYVRHMQDVVVPYAILGGVTVFFVRKKTRLPKEFVITLILFLLLLTSDLRFPFSLFKEAYFEESEHGYLYFREVNKTPNDCLILTTHNMVVTSDVFKNNKRRAIQLSMITLNNGSIAKEEIKNSSCVLYFSDYMCQRYIDDPSISDSNCKFIYENLNLTYLYTSEGVWGNIDVYNVTLKN